MRFFDKKRYATFRQWQNTKKYFRWASSDFGIGALCEYLVFFYYSDGIDFLRTKGPTNMGGANDMLIEHLENGYIDLFHEFHVNYDPDIVNNDIFRTTKEVLIDAAEKFHVMNQLNPLPEQLLMYINDSGYVEFEPFFRINIDRYRHTINALIQNNPFHMIGIKWQHHNSYDFDVADNHAAKSLHEYFENYYYYYGIEYIRNNITQLPVKRSPGIFFEDGNLIVYSRLFTEEMYDPLESFYTTPAELLAITEQFHQYHQQNPMPDVIVIYRDEKTNTVHLKPLYKENSTGFWQYVRGIFSRGRFKK